MNSSSQGSYHQDEYIPVGQPVESINYGYNYQQQAFSGNQFGQPTNLIAPSYPIQQQYQGSQLLMPQQAVPISAPAPGQRPQPYVSKWQKLAQILNQDNPQQQVPAPQVFPSDNQRPQLIQEFYSQSKASAYPTLQNQEPVELTAAQKMQREIEESNRKMKEQQDRMMNFVAKKTVGPSGPGPASIETGIPIATKADLAKGYSTYVMHKVNPNETLDRVSIIYNVPKDAIRKANGFTGDEIYMKKELIIPNATGPVFQTDSKPVVQNEEQRKRDLIELMSQDLKEKFGKQASYKAEAQYYLEITNYNYEKALKEFDEDMKFEKEQENKFKNLKGKNKKGEHPLLYLKK